MVRSEAWWSAICACAVKSCDDMSDTIATNKSSLLSSVSSRLGRTPERGRPLLGLPLDDDDEGDDICGGSAEAEILVRPEGAVVPLPCDGDVGSVPSDCLRCRPRSGNGSV